MKTSTFTRRVVVDSDAPNYLKEAALQDARRRIGNELFDMLWRGKLPAVVDIEEVIIKGYWSPEPNFYIHPPFPEKDSLEIRVNITPVEHRQVVLQSEKMWLDELKFMWGKRSWLYSFLRVIKNWKRRASWKIKKNRHEQTN